MLSNDFKSIGHSHKASKTSPTYRNFNFGTLDEAFQTQSFGLLETSQEYSPKIRNILVVFSNSLRSSKSILEATYVIVYLDPKLIFIA